MISWPARTRAGSLPDTTAGTTARVAALWAKSPATLDRDEVVAALDDAYGTITSLARRFDAPAFDWAPTRRALGAPLDEADALSPAVVDGS
jgi:hypothetical protein